MNVTVEEISSIRKKLVFEVEKEVVDAEIEKAYAKVGKSAKIKGFRPGKVPRKVLEQYYAPQVEGEVLNSLINESYFKALVEHRLPAIGDPEIVQSGDLEKGKPFTYEAEIEVKPEVEAKDYTGLSLQKEKFVENDQIVDDRLEEMRTSRAQLEVTTRKKARDGDSVLIDFEGFVDGEPFEGGKAEGHLLELGSGAFIPGFEEQIEGMKREDEKDVEVTFPENYGNKELAGKPATFKVKLQEIKEKVAPKLNNDFAKEFGMETLAELKEKVLEGHVQQEQGRIDGDLRERLVTALIERNPLEVPEAMVKGQLEYMLGNVRNRMKSQGMSLEMLGITEESFAQMYRDTAVNQVKGSLILEAIARQEDIKVEDDEIDGKLEEIAKMAGAPLEAVKNHYGKPEDRRGLISQIAEEKVVQLLLEKAEIEEVEAEQLADKGEGQAQESDKE